LKIIPCTTRKIISLYLALILAAVTLTPFFTSSSSMSMIDAYAIKDVEKEKIECNNVNLNLTALDVVAVPEPLRSNHTMIHSFFFAIFI
jgi:hypothetical protein